MTVSWVILTHNRAEVVNKCISHCMANAGCMWDELIWVDNGSCEEEFFKLDFTTLPDIVVLNRQNLGVAKGYNRGMGLATKDYIVITGSDMLMPDNWLRTFRDYVETVPGIACIYSKPIGQVPERLRGTAQIISGLPIIPALALERRIFKRSLLADIGYFPETFGLYGYDDVAWAMRAEKVCLEKGLGCYVIPDQIAQHLGTEGADKYDGKDASDYHAMKSREAADPAKKAELRRLDALGWPRFTPFL